MKYCKPQRRLDSAAAQPRSLPRLACGFVACLLFVGLFGQEQVAQNPQDEEVLTVNTDLVVLNVTATDARGSYVHGLKRSDFKVLDEGRPRPLTSFSEEETPFAAALLLDVSGSMEGRVSLARSAAIRFLDGLRVDDVAAVYSFYSKAEQVQEFSASRDLTPRAFGLRAKGMTVLNDAIILAASDLAKRPERRRAIVVLSDGGDTYSSASAEKALNAALASNSTIYTVDMADHTTASVGAAASTAALRNFAAKSGGRFVPSPGGKELREAFAGILEELSNQYTLGFKPADTTRDGRWRSVAVSVDRSDINVRTRRGYRLSKP